jgi:hypothetical protein
MVRVCFHTASVASHQITNWLNAAQDLPMVVIC